MFLQLNHRAVLLTLDLTFNPSSFYGSVAQLVEQWPEEPRAVGSTPTGTTIYC